MQDLYDDMYESDSISIFDMDGRLHNLYDEDEALQNLNRVLSCSEIDIDLK